MNILSKTMASAIAAICVVAPTHASIVITMRTEQLNTGVNSIPIAGGTLLQLVDLGADGVFNPISIADGSVGSLTQWVSGDDAVLDAAFTATVGTTTGVAGDFPSTAAFDMRHANQTESTNGRLNRIFEFANGVLTTNTKVGLRWFPGLLASNFGTITLAGGQGYGQFTRNVGSLDGGATVINGGSLWIVPADGATVTFDSLFTTENVGTESSALGDAKYTVIPEPGAIVLSLMGAAGLTMLRRRRS